MPQAAGANSVVNAAGAGSSSGGSAFNAPFTHAALARIQSGDNTGGADGDGDMVVAFLGDSTTAGVELPYGIGCTQSTAQLLTQAGFPAALGASTAKPAAEVAATDLRWVAGAGWTQAVTVDGLGAAGAYFTGAIGAAGQLTFTPSGGYSYTSFDVYGWGGGTVQLQIDGGAPTAFVTTAGGITKQTITAAAAANHVLQLGTVTGAPVNIMFIDAYNVNTPRIRVANLGVPGAQASTMASTAGGALGSIASIQAYAPVVDAWVINLGINDSTHNIGAGAFLTNLAPVIAACKASPADIYLCSCIPSQVVGLEAAYAQALPAFCAQNGYGFIDLFNRWGGQNGYAKLQPLGFYFDTVHPSQFIGYPDVARATVNALLAA